MQLVETTQAAQVLPSWDAVYLTPYLRTGQIQAAQDASYVSIPHVEAYLDIDSWSGYISVGEKSSYHLFFWFFYCTGLNCASDPVNKTDNSSTPLLIWLNGGPGFSSMAGLFEEIGPLRANPNGTVTRRDAAWTNHFDVIFIDDLMDTGFSYSESGQRTKSVKEAAEHLFEFLEQFYQIFPDAKAKDLYIGGQSYGGKYAPELAGLVNHDKSINLKGVFMGSGLMNPRQMLPLTPDFLESTGMLNAWEARTMREAIQHGLERHKCNPVEGVLHIMYNIFGKLGWVMGSNGTDSILYTSDYDWKLEVYLNQPIVQKAIHVKPTKFFCSNDKIIMDMAEDFFDGVDDVLVSLLDAGVKVLVFNGQFDPLVSVPMTEKFLSTLEWSGKEQYLAGDGKVLWRDSEGTVVGYVTKAANLTRVLIRNAGHRTTIDQPWPALDMIRRFVSDLPFNDEKNIMEGKATDASV